MGQTRKEAKLVLFAGVDEATLQRSIAQFHKLEQAEQGASDAMVKRIQTVRQSLSASVANAKQEAVVSAEVARSINIQIRSREQLIATIDRQANAQRNAILKGGAASAAAPVAGGMSGGGKASSALAALGSVLPGLSGDIARSVGNLSRLTEQITRFSSETGIAISSMGKATPALSALNTGIGGLAAGGIAAVALVALSIAIEQFVKQVNEAQSRLDTAFQARLNANELVLTATQAEIDAMLEAKEARLAAIDTTLAEADAARQAAESVGGFQGALADLANFLGFTTTKAEKKALEEKDALQADIGELSRARNDERVVARSAAAAIKDATDSAAKQAKETDKVARASEKVVIKQAELAKSTNELAIFYDNINARQQSAAETTRKQETDLVQDRLRIFADYAQRIKDAEVQAKRDEAREARRAAFDRLVALKQRELSEFDLLLRGDFAGVSRSRREGQVQAEVDRYRAEFEANEKLISQRERDFDDQLSLNRQLAELTTRISQERIGAAQSELGFMREQVSEFFRLKGYLGDVSRFTNDQITRFYKIVAQIAGAPQINFGAKLGGAGASAALPRFGQPAQSQPTGFGSGGGFAPTGGFQPTNTTSNVFNINGVTDPKAVARAVDERLRAVTRQ